MRQMTQPGLFSPSSPVTTLGGGSPGGGPAPLCPLLPGQLVTSVAPGPFIIR